MKLNLLQLLHRQPKELIVENNVPFIYSEEQLMARLKFFIGVCLALTLTGIVFVVLYSLIFVTQPLNAISPIDQKFFELIVPIATFLTGTLSGIMLSGGTKEEQESKMAMMKMAQDNAAAAAKSTATTLAATIAPVTPSVSSTPAPAAAPSQPAPVVTGFGGKLAPPAAPQPEI
jgi:hypothetical protein